MDLCRPCQGLSSTSAPDSTAAVVISLIVHFVRGRPVLLEDDIEITTISTTQKLTVMKSKTEDKLEGKFHEMQGKTKEKHGKLTNNPALEAEGREEKRAGKRLKGKC